MKKTTHTQRISHAIMLGYLWRWGAIILIFVIPIFVFKICKMIGIASAIQSVSYMFSMGVLLFYYGIHHIIGAIFEFKHILVASQLANRQEPNPRRSWTDAEKTENISCGIIFVVIGAGMTICCLLYVFGILD